MKANSEEEPTKSEIVANTWKCYIPTALTLGGTIVAAVTGHHIAVKEIGAAYAMYASTNSFLNSYRNNVREMLGEKQAAEIEQRIAEQQIMMHPPEENVNIFNTGRGTDLFYDEMFGGYFLSSFDNVRNAAIDFNNQIINDTFATYNDLRYHLGLPMVKSGSSIVYQAGEKLDLDISYHVKPTPNGPDCHIITYNLPSGGIKEQYPLFD